MKLFKLHVVKNIRIILYKIIYINVNIKRLLKEIKKTQLHGVYEPTAFSEFILTTFF